MKRVGDFGYLYCKIEDHEGEGDAHFVGFTVLDDIVYVIDGIPGTKIYKGSKDSFCKILSNPTTRCIFEMYLGEPFEDGNFHIEKVETTVSGICREIDPMINYYQEYDEFDSAINHPVIVTKGDWRSAGGLVLPFNVRLISKQSDEWTDLDELMTTHEG